jgi:hypothetical protein
MSSTLPKKIAATVGNPDKPFHGTTESGIDKTRGCDEGLHCEGINDDTERRTARIAPTTTTTTTTTPAPRKQSETLAMKLSPSTQLATSQEPASYARIESFLLAGSALSRPFVGSATRGKGAVSRLVVCLSFHSKEKRFVVQGSFVPYLLTPELL